MVTEVDEGRGLVKVYWQDIRKRVAKVEPKFAKIVDALSPDKTFPLYLAYYPYGALTGDTISPLISLPDGGFYRLTDPNAPKDVVKHLGYGMHDSPLGMILDKSFEFYIDLKNDGITIPRKIYKPGDFFSFLRNLNGRNTISAASNNIHSLISGARSVFMLPNIECSTHHANLQKDFNIKSAAPKSLYQHWDIFRELCEANDTLDWKACLIFFSEKWLHKLNTDSSWAPLKLYLYDKAWAYFKFDIVRSHDDYIFSMLQKDSNLKPNPYMADTARHLFNITVGNAPGYAPATDASCIPLDYLQKVYIESYGLKKYIPIILQPQNFDLESIHPIYYSFHYPSTGMFSPKARKISSILYDMRELSYILRKYIKGLSERREYSDTLLSYLASRVQFDYFHNEVDKHRIIRSSHDILDIDDRFNNLNLKEILSQAQFAGDARFLRGCISIRKK